MRLEDILKEKTRKSPNKAGLGFFMLEDENLPEEPDVFLEVEEEKIEQKSIPQPKIIHFTFYCPSCKKWYGLKEFAQVECPICKEQLRLSYNCPNCEKRFMVKEPGIHKCPTCQTKLVP